MMLAMNFIIILVHLNQDGIYQTMLEKIHRKAVHQVGLKWSEVIPMEPEWFMFIPEPMKNLTICPKIGFKM
jgi:hypothetical protein